MNSVEISPKTITGGARIRGVSAEAGLLVETNVELLSAEAGTFSAEAGGLGINAGLSDITAIPDVTWDVGKDRFSGLSWVAGDSRFASNSDDGDFSTFLRLGRTEDKAGEFLVVLGVAVFLVLLAIRRIAIPENKENS